MDRQNLKLYNLELEDNLFNIRKELEEHNTINDTLSFSKKSPEGEFAEIVREYEENFLLKDIIDDVKSHNYLYLIKNSRPGWKILNEKFKLDYGCTMSFDGIKKAKYRAFIMKDCELVEIKPGGYEKGKLEFESKEDWMKKTNLFIEGDGDDANIMNFVRLGISMKGLKDENFSNEIKSTYQYTGLGKVTLKFSKENLELTDEFKSAIKEAIKSKELINVRKITKKYGQFIPTEIILGGRVYLKDVKIMLKNCADNSKEGSVNGGSIGQIGYGSNSIKKKSKFYSSDYMKILGGKHPDDENFDEKAWIESLEDYHNWDCIEFKNPISIYQFLPDELRKEFYETIGKRILYTSTEDYNYDLHELGRHRTFELKNMPENILEIILNDEADCDIFATVVNTNEDSNNVFFNCQIFRKPKAKPGIIIHGIQDKFQQCKYQLKIKIMVIGYDTDFNFILSDTNVKLNKEIYDSESPCLFNSMKFKLEHELITKNTPFLGIPILNNLDSSNNSLIIGHNFCNTQHLDDKFRIDTFTYCVKNKLYVNLPKFTFCTLIIYCNTALTSSYESFPFEFKKWKTKTPFIEFKEPNPGYISLYLSKDNNHNPIFLNQKNKQINVEYVDCNCSKTCFICKNKTFKISTDQNNIECKVYSLR
ncbi:hypothetical protein GLOIN_2v759589 [Rhizophagus clarus]|nr:hypothetical protein GLOIN_2v759589 [Rhizophagus clarus]